MVSRINMTAGRALLFLFCLTFPITWAAAQQGGKAEGTRVRFARGGTTATYNGRVRGSIEVEYELQAKTGQELIVRVVSNPPDSAVVKIQGPNFKALQMSCLAATGEVAKSLGLASEASCFDDDPRKLRRDGKTWSAALPESGAYTLSVLNPERGSGVFTYTITIIVRPDGKQITSTLSSADSASLDVAMRKFISALKNRNVEGFLSLFSRTRFFYASNPLNVVRVAISYNELAADLRKKGDWYFTYLERGDGGNYDAFVDNTGDGEMWRRGGGARFTPPGTEISDSTYVEWRKEGNRWVIDEISY
jgi:hypothetical protein